MPVNSEARQAEKPVKTYAVVVDVSPSEQLVGNPADPKFVGLVFGLYSRKSFELVGPSFPDPARRLRLRKWSSANAGYKWRFVEHLRDLDTTHRVVFGANVATNMHIARSGAAVWEQVWGPYPEPSSYNKNGRPRVMLGGYSVGGEPVDPFEVLIDDLKVVGWYARVLVSAQQSLSDLNGEPVVLEALIDRLPGDGGPEGPRKAVLLKETCARLSDGHCRVVGVPSTPDSEPRDLLVDNVAGLFREMVESGRSDLYGEAEDLFRVTRLG